MRSSDEGTGVIYKNGGTAVLGREEVDARTKQRSRGFHVMRSFCHVRRADGSFQTME